jgi:uncharacterized protein YgfB (UPF0149 family)
MEKQKWIDEIFESIDGIQPAENENISWQTIQQQLTNEKQAQHLAFKQSIKWIAAAIIMAVMNISVVLFINKQHQQPDNNLAIESMAKEMGVLNSYNY